MRASYSIVTADLSHLSAIPAIEQAAAAQFPANDLPDELRFLVTDSETLKDATQDGRLWVALTVGDVPVGFALTAVVDDEAHLQELDVHPDFGRRGIGTRLMRRAIRWANDRGHAGMSLITFGHIPWNAPFYESLGFVRQQSADIGSGLRQILQEEGEAGIDTSLRVCMRLPLEQPVSPE